MTALPTLRPTADGTISSTLRTGVSTNWEAIDDDPDSNDGATTHIRNNGYTASQFNLLTDMPSDFASMVSLELKISYLGEARSDDSLSLTAQIFQSDESTALTDAVTVASNLANSGSYTTTTSAFSTINSPSNKTTWDGARLKLTWAGTVVMSNDGALIRVTAVEVNGTYLKSSYTISEAAFPVGTARVGPFKF